jgi:hypothetical protein
MSIDMKNLIVICEKISHETRNEGELCQLMKITQKPLTAIIRVPGERLHGFTRAGSSSTAVRKLCTLERKRSIVPTCRCYAHLHGKFQGMHKEVQN